jgi:hypothetical protein
MIYSTQTRHSWTRRSALALALGSVACAFLMSGSPAHAKASSFPSPTWRLEKQAVQPLFSVGNSLLAETQTGTTPDILINGESDAMTSFAAPQSCQPGGANATQILYLCAGQSNIQVPVLYTPASGSSSTPNAGPLDQACHNGGGVGCTLNYVGKYWIAWNVSDCSDGTHCSYHVIYQNIATGQIEQQATDGGGRIDDNPNTSVLARTICAPLRVPTFKPDYGPSQIGSVLFIGRYALLSNQSGTEIAECGSPFHRQFNFLDLIDPEAGPIAAGNFVAWISATHTISYFNLLTHQVGYWTTPAKIGQLVGIFSAGGRLFLHGNGSIWSAEIPKRRT